VLASVTHRGRVKRSRRYRIAAQRNKKGANQARCHDSSQHRHAGWWTGKYSGRSEEFDEQRHTNSLDP